MNTRLVALGAVVVVAGCGGSAKKGQPPTPPPPPPSPTSTVLAPRNSVLAGSARAELSVSSGEPKVNEKWRYRVVVTNRGGHPIRGTITVQIVDSLGQAHPVQLDDTKRNITNMPFRGTFEDYIEFPPDSRGTKLTVRMAVKTLKGNPLFAYPVKPR